MTPLRKRMIRELELQRKSPNTVKAYVTAVAELSGHYRRNPEELSVEEIRSFLHYLIAERKLAFSSCNQKLAGIRFFYKFVLGREDFCLKVAAKRSGRLPEPLGRGEIRRLLDATSNLKHRTLLMTCYGGGLRAGELVALTPQDIHSDRLLIRVNQGKGRKDRYTLLSPRLLAQLRSYWCQYRPRTFLFEGRTAATMLSASTATTIFNAAKQRTGITHGRGIHSLRHSFGTHLMEAGVPLPVIQQLMGHTSLKTTTKYLHVTSKHLGSVQSPLDLLRLPKPDELV